MNSTNIFKQLAFLLIIAVFAVGCDSDDPDDDGAGEEELITLVTMILNTDSDIVVGTANDPDGDGTNFQIETLTLQSNTTYTGSITLEDEINGEDITEEVEEEADEHQFFFTPSASLADRITVTINDTDSNGLPVGLDFTVTVSDGGPATGTLNVVLGHYDEGPKDGVTRSDESDIDIDFPITIE